MQTYNDLKTKLLSIGFKEIQSKRTIHGDCRTIMSLGYGHNADQNPPHTLHVLRCESNASGHARCDDWIITEQGHQCQLARSIEHVWTVGRNVMERAMQPATAISSHD